MATPKEWHGRPQTALIPYETFLQLLAFKEDVATAIAEVRDNAPMMGNPGSKNTEGNNDSN